jgi:hypothetical protein
MPLKTATWRIGAGVVAVLIATIFPVAAEIEDDTYGLEFYAGSYIAGPDFLDDDVVYGVRLMINTTERFTWGADIGYFSTVGEGTDGGSTFTLDYSDLYVDFLFGGNFFPEKRASLMLYGGGGWSDASVDLVTSGMIGNRAINGIDADSLTLNAGVNLAVELSELIYLRFDYRSRWFDERVGGETDQTATVALGFMVGR